MTQQVFTEKDNGATVKLHTPTDKFIIDLESNPSTGYSWHLKNNAAEHDPTSNRLPGAFKATSTMQEKASSQVMVGAPARQQLTIEPAKELQRGKIYTLECVYARNTRMSDAAKHYTLRVTYP